jgi:hypothetical protein
MINHKKFILIITGFVILFTSCNNNGKIEKQEKAQKMSDYIIENLTKSEVFKEFPEKYFPKEKTEKRLGDIKTNCDWANRKGKFVDYFTMEKNGKNRTAYIYEYFLNCDSLRFILIYDMEQKDPELFQFNIEPIEEPSQMIIDPSKQLLNQK